jgi:RHS repeat-associated protein
LGSIAPVSPVDPANPRETSVRPEDYLFEVVFDYGEHAATTPTPTENNYWGLRLDPFSSNRAGFEVRTYRLCERVLLFHRFGVIGSAPPVLVKSTDFVYKPSRVVTYLSSVTHRGYIANGTGVISQQGSLPELSFSYQLPVLQDRLAALPQESLEGLAGGVDGGRKQWVDLDGEGIAGVLIDADGAWYYKSNRGGGKLTAPKRLHSMPSPGSLVGGVQKLEDVGGDGQLDLVQYGPPLSGYFSRTPEGSFEAHRTFQTLPNIDWNDPNLRFIDLDGDGHGDLLITEDHAFIWYRSKAKGGFEAPSRVYHSSDEDKGPAIVFADGTQSIQLADMSGDGLVDIVRVRNGEICYWPNLGYGRFGAKITLEHSPLFAPVDQFDARRLRFADIDGSGTTDIFYLGTQEIAVYLNESGNRLSEKHPLRSMPPVDNVSTVSTVDLLGQGTTCLVWSSPLPAAANRPVFYIDIMGGVKPHLLSTVKNNLGAETKITYGTSTQHYLKDLSEGHKWLTRLSFPVQVVDQITHEDFITKSRLVTTYRYHHGFFDGEEREFRGFACVEQWDAEKYEEGTVGELNQKPVHSKTWFHTGVWLEGVRLEKGLKEEYFGGGVSGELKDFCLPDTVNETDELGLPMSVQDAREAARALRGHVLRTEVYSDDGSDLAKVPYLVTEQNFAVRRIQSANALPKGAKHGVFFSYPRETLTIHTERQVSDPRIAHELVLAVNQYGDVERKASVVYGRVERAGVPLPDEQKRAYATLTEARFAVHDEDDWYRASVACEQATWELVGLPKRTLWTKSELETEIAKLPLAEYENPVTDLTVARRLVERNCQLFKSETVGDAYEYLDLGTVGEHAIPFEKYSLALTPGLVSTLVGESATLGGATGQLTTTILENEGKYAHPNFAPRVSTSSNDVNYWVPSGRVKLDTVNFFLPVEATDPFGKTYTVEYDEYSLLIKATVDPLGNRVEVMNDYRVLAPKEVKDPNLNRSAVGFDALGMVIWTAVMGKLGANQGDTAEHPTTRFEYHLDNWRVNSRPSYVKTSVREIHYFPGLTDDVPWQDSFTYSDGFGRVVMQKVQAEAGFVPGIATEVTDRWVGTGRTVFNNKGNPVKQYEPFFSATPDYEDEATVVMTGVTPVIHYDPLDRVVRTDLPNGTFSKVVFDAWKQENWDPNDNVLDIECKWFKDRTGTGSITDAAERNAATLAAKHANTPSVTHLDSLGRAFLVEADNGPDPANPSAKLIYRTKTELDIEGNQLGIIDARNNRTIDQKFDVLGRRIAVTSPDAGKRLTVADVAGKPLRSWDSRGQTMRSTYDALQRPTHVWVRQRNSTDEDVVLRTVYGESLDTAQSLNLRGQTYMVFDGAGLAKSEEFDFKGNLSSSTRHLAKTYTETPKWNALPELNSDPTEGPIVTPVTVEAAAVNPTANLLEVTSDTVPTRFSTSTTYDALNRVVSSTAPDGSESKPEYNRANFLERMLVTSGGATRAAVHHMSYNEKGQRLACEYSGEASPTSTAVYRTLYTYDPKTFRLKTLVTERASDGIELQRLTYTYDPVGNIVEIRDEGSPAPIFANPVAEQAHGLYEYDALYRLIQAEGREHPGQQVTQSDAESELGRTLPHANDTSTLIRYRETYRYDEVGNILRVHHQPLASSHPAWERRYLYAYIVAQADSSVTASNRLIATSMPGDADTVYSARYDYADGTDASDPTHNNAGLHGSMTRMPHLSGIHWDYADRMRRCEKSNGTVSNVYFTYDASGQRVRKVYEHAPYREERIYLGGYEIYRRVNSGTLDVHRTTLHVMDDQRRVAMVENTLADSDHPTLTGRRWRFQLDNHLGTACLEVDHEGKVISYEEYHPYGTSALRVQDSSAGVSQKRYRYTGKERDEETSLYYHGARYYAPWLGRWTAADPLGIEGPTHTDFNLYAYVRGAVIGATDPTGHADKPIDGTKVKALSTEKAFLAQYRALGQGKKPHPSVRTQAAQSTTEATGKVASGPTPKAAPSTGHAPVANSEQGRDTAPKAGTGKSNSVMAELTAAAGFLNLEAPDAVRLDGTGSDKGIPGGHGEGEGSRWAQAAYIASAFAPVLISKFEKAGVAIVRRAGEAIAGAGKAALGVLKSLGPKVAGALEGAGRVMASNLGSMGGDVPGAIKGAIKGWKEAGQAAEVATSTGTTLTRRMAGMLSELRAGKDVVVRNMDEARVLLEESGLKPFTSQSHVPSAPAPRGTYRGDLLNTRNPTAPFVHPPGSAPPAHATNAHFNLYFNDGKKAAIIVAQ